MTIARGLGLLVTILATASPLMAQRGRRGSDGGPRPPSFSITAGAAPYDLSANGTGPFGAIRIEVPAGRLFVIEPGLTFFRFTSEVDETVNLLFTEVSVQAQVPGRGVRPYAGLGIGFSEFLSGRGGNDFVGHVAGGIRFPFGGRWGGKLEARGRTLNFDGSIVELGFGIRRSFGPYAR